MKVLGNGKWSRLLALQLNHLHDRVVGQRWRCHHRREVFAALDEDVARRQRRTRRRRVPRCQVWCVWRTPRWILGVAAAARATHFDRAKARLIEAATPGGRKLEIAVLGTLRWSSAGFRVAEATFSCECERVKLQHESQGSNEADGAPAGVLRVRGAAV